VAAGDGPPRAPADVPAVSADSLDLHRALGRLTPRHREVLVLHYVAELPLDEVARQLRLPPGTVKSRLHRARSALAKQVGDERQGSPMRDDLLKEQLMSYARTAADEAAARTQELGGTVLLPPMDIPVGRFTIVADPQGAVFTASAVPGGPARGLDGS
jgi:Sigma-70, region 4